MAKPTSTQKAALSKETMTKRAMALADEGGIHTLSMRKLARALGVEAMSLYHHVKNKDQLLDAMVDAVFAKVEVPVAEVQWLSAMRSRAASLREAMLSHRWAIGLMDSRRHAGPSTLTHHNAVLGNLRHNGFSVVQAAHAFSLMDSYVYGFVLQEVALPFESTAELENVAEEMQAANAMDEYPHIQELMVKHALKPGYQYRDEFWVGLDLVLESLAKMLGDE